MATVTVTATLGQDVGLIMEATRPDRIVDVVTVMMAMIAMMVLRGTVVAVPVAVDRLLAAAVAAQGHTIDHRHTARYTDGRGGAGEFWVCVGT